KLGDLRSHYYPIGLSTGEAQITPGAVVHFGYTIMNSGKAGGSAADVQSALDGISDAARDVVQKAYPIPYVWDYLNQGTHAINQYFVGWCDGGVAAGRLDLSADDLDNLTSATGFADGTIESPGTDSKPGCGSNSLYYVHYRISRRAMPPCASNS